jgi:hypothetical protein
MGWEEMAYTSTAHLLRTCLSKKQSQGPVQAQAQVEPLEGTDRLKKQIAAVLDRVRAGQAISEE